MDEFRQHAQSGEHAHVIGVVVDHHSCVVAHAMQFGVDVDGRRDVPAAADDPCVRVDHADVGGGDLLPPEAPWVDEHVGLPIRLPGDVPGEILGEPDRCQVAERDRQRLLVGQVNADRRNH